MNRKYSGFTLVEMLIVMGIIIILMAVGITAGRFAINRANDVAHQNAADQLFVAAQSFMTDEREYPLITNFATSMACQDNPATPCLGQYLSTGEFRGGTDATFAYWTNDAQGAALVCVSLGGTNDNEDRGWYCTGNGFSSETSGPGSIAQKDIEAGVAIPSVGWDAVQEWSNDTDNFPAAADKEILEPGTVETAEPI